MAKSVDGRNRPLFTLISSCVSVGAVVFGVTGYFASERIDHLKRQYEGLSQTNERRCNDDRKSRDYAITTLEQQLNTCKEGDSAKQKSIDNLSADNDKLQRQVAELDKTVVQCRGLLSECEGCPKELIDLKTRFAIVIGQLEGDLRQEREKVAELTERLRKTREQCALLSQKKRDLEIELGRAQCRHKSLIDNLKHESTQVTGTCTQAFRRFLEGCEADGQLNTNYAQLISLDQLCPRGPER